MTFWELNEYLKGRHLDEQKRWAHTRLIVAALTGQPPKEIIRLPAIDGGEQKVSWTPELAEQVLKHFNEWPM